MTLNRNVRKWRMAYNISEMQKTDNILLEENSENEFN